MYTKEQFLSDVTVEAKALRATATKEERMNLSANRVFYDSTQDCIYGQISGSCFSSRASELIQACCPRYFVNKINADPLTQVRVGGFNIIAESVNGDRVVGFENRRSHYYMHYSAIEIYISTKNANITSLVAFLREETEELNLDF